MKARWQAERAAIDRIKMLKERADRLRTESERAQRTGNLQRAAEIEYGELLALVAALDRAEKRLADLQAEGTWLREEVDAGDIAEVVADWTGIPVASLVESERQRLVRLEALLGRRVIGQNEALAAVSNAVRRSRAGLQDPNRPVGSFIFLGPTGVGKTETARALAEFLFNDERAMVRLDMSEYMERHAVSRLLGAPPGYVGYDQGGQLTEAVRRRPHAVILFDEIEKAHADIFNVLLQILDDGRLTDAQGRAVDFRNAVVIMTSNIGSRFILKEAGNEQWELVEAAVKQELHAHFRPEFLNRVDDIVLFRPLDRSAIREIVELQLARVEALAGELGITLDISFEAKDLLAREGYDPAFGARPLRRVIQRRIQDPLALSLLEEESEAPAIIQIRPAAADARLVFERKGE